MRRRGSMAEPFRPLGSNTVAKTKYRFARKPCRGVLKNLRLASVKDDRSDCRYFMKKRFRGILLKKNFKDCRFSATKAGIGLGMPSIDRCDGVVVCRNRFEFRPDSQRRASGSRDPLRAEKRACRTPSDRRRARCRPPAVESASAASRRLPEIDRRSIAGPTVARGQKFRRGSAESRGEVNRARVDQTMMKRSA